MRFLWFAGHLANLYGFRLELLLTSGEVVVDTGCRLSLLLSAGVALFNTQKNGRSVGRSVGICEWAATLAQKIDETCEWLGWVGLGRTMAQKSVQYMRLDPTHGTHGTTRDRYICEWTATTAQQVGDACGWTSAIVFIIHPTQRCIHTQTHLSYVDTYPSGVMRETTSDARGYYTTHETMNTYM